MINSIIEDYMEFNGFDWIEWIHKLDYTYPSIATDDYLH